MKNHSIYILPLTKEGTLGEMKDDEFLQGVTSPTKS